MTLRKIFLLMLMVLTQYQLKFQKKNSKHKKNIIVTSVYRPPNTNPKHFVSKVNNFLHQLHHENKHAFILGDYNINTIAAMVSPVNVVNDFQNTFLSYYFHPLITKPTRIFKNKSSLLDNIMHIHKFLKYCSKWHS